MLSARKLCLFLPAVSQTNLVISQKTHDILQTVSKTNFRTIQKTFMSSLNSMTDKPCFLAENTMSSFDGGTELRKPGSDINSFADKHFYHSESPMSVLNDIAE